MFCRSVSLCSLGLALVMMSGCGRGPASDAPDLLPVTGKVLSDGKPLANAIVEFTPDTGGAMSTSTTDTEGNFELIYSDGRKGAIPGQHQVRVAESMPAAAGSEGGEVTISAKPPEETVQTVVVDDEKSFFEFTL